MGAVERVYQFGLLALLFHTRDKRGVETEEEREREREHF